MHNHPALALYVILIISLACQAIYLPKQWFQKCIALVAIFLIYIFPFYMFPKMKNNQKMAQQQSHEKYRESIYIPAMELFSERCKSAGEKIYQTKENIEGILLLNIRPQASHPEWEDPHWPDAALPLEFSGLDYIRVFLQTEARTYELSRGTFHDPQDARGQFKHHGYSYVDVKEGDTIVRYRYARFDSKELVREIAPAHPARYAVSFRNINAPDDRKHWVAGTVVTISDTQTHEIIAEKTWFSVSPPRHQTVQESNALSNRPHRWQATGSTICPRKEYSFNTSRGATRMFVDQVLQPPTGRGERKPFS